MTADAVTIVTQNLLQIRERIAEASQRCGRRVEEVTLVGVAKYVDAATTACLFRAGCVDIGESRPQQLWEKVASAELSSLPIRWHQIGHLQRNKVARTVPLATLIHTADSERLLRAIDAAANPPVVVPVLLEINTSGDIEKHGLTADHARELIGRRSEFPNCRFSGLMTMAAREGGATVARKNFASLRQLRDELLPGGDLSMGMSGDFEEAIAEGATIIRVGSALFRGLR